MKTLLKVASIAGFLMMLGCSNNANELRPLDAGVCNNPNCKCAKPCQCGAGCQCGMKGNSNNMSDNQAK
ncbi:MAG: hypothetical protein IE887_10300 [Campylobacterales bacterium]|nr:hypothetical protein [Campylobacterales bacterium]